MPSKVSNKAEDNYIKLEPTGESGAVYAHGGRAKDIQEFSLHLPAIGNMMSDAWDIIHGPNRDDAQTDNNSSLQGRLDSFKAMEKDAIPMKRNTDGTFVGSRINGNSNRTVGANKILEENLSTSFDQDDAWIRTKIDTTGLNNTNKLSGISIHHTWHKQADTTSTTNKNTDNVNSAQVSDKIDLYTPIVDKAGHVVGKNTETVTLPYGYKTIITNGRGEDTEINTFDKVAAKTQNIVAENTQDELAINSGNEWIRIDTDATNDILTISHDIHKTSSDSHDTDWTQAEANTTIPTTTYEFDNAGHYVSHHTENYKLPFGYGKIVGDSGNTEATATYDEVKFTSDEWLTATISKDTVTYSHNYPNVQEDTSTDFDMNTATTQDNKDKIVLETLRHDSTGHIINVNQHTVTLPYGYKTIKVENSDSVLGAPFHTGEAQETATNTQDNLKFTASNKWIKMMPTGENDIEFGHILSPIAPEDEKIKLNSILHKSTDTNISEFGGSFNILNFTTDNAGHIIAVGQDTITIPQGKYKNDTPNTDSSSLLVGIALDGPTGEITTTSATTNTLKLTNYSLPTSVDNNGILSSNQSINEAFGRLEYRINEEINKREAAFDLLYYGEDGKEGKTISKAFDTIKEIADFLEQDENNKQSGVEKIISDINTNTDAIGVEELRATSAEANLATNIATEEARAKGVEQTLTTNLNNEITRAKSAESTLTTNLNEEITRAINAENTLNTRITDLVGNTSVSTQIADFSNTLGTAAKSDVNDFAPAGYYDDRVLTSVYEAKITSLEATIAALEARIAALEPQPEPPVSE